MLFLPIGDGPNDPGRPWVTWTLIATNVLIFLSLLPLSAQPAAESYELERYREVTERQRPESASPPVFSAYDAFLLRWGSRPASLSPVTALTSMFLHGGWMHLIGNMLFLWLFGDNVEHRLGRIGFLLVYFATGLAATLGDAALRPGSEIPAVGASGAISGILGAYFVWFPKNIVRLFILLPFLFVGVREFTSRVFLGAYLILNNIVPVVFAALSGGGGGGVSYGAHIGGFIAGAVIAFGLNLWLKRPEKHPPSHEIFAGDSPAAEFDEALRRDDLDRASDVSRSGVELDPRARLLFAQRLEAAGRPHDALKNYEAAARDRPDSVESARAHIGAARVLLRQLGMPTAAYQRLLEVVRDRPASVEQSEARALMDEIARRVDRLPSSRPRL